MINLAKVSICQSHNKSLTEAFIEAGFAVTISSRESMRNMLVFKNYIF